MISVAFYIRCLLDDVAWFGLRLVHDKARERSLVRGLRGVARVERDDDLAILYSYLLLDR